MRIADRELKQGMLVASRVFGRLKSGLKNMKRYWQRNRPNWTPSKRPESMSWKLPAGEPQRLPELVAGIAAHDIVNAYSAYRTGVTKLPGGFFLEAMAKNPLLAAILGASAAAGVGLLHQSLEKSAALVNPKRFRKLKRLGLAAAGALSVPYIVGSYKRQRALTHREDPGDI